MNISKAHWVSDSGRVSLAMPINKVDSENRTVSGFASLDNLDSQGDIVTAEAAVDAFDRFRGNLREMHQPIAVGKVVSFDQKPLYDAETDKTYSGVYVTAYISTGAQDTWEKILDGTLTGFSIGGVIVDAEDVFDKVANSMIRVISKMDLFELSVVDNPANELANIVSITKTVNEAGAVIKTASGIAVDVETENIYWCGADQIAIASKNETSPSCFSCGKSMENIGWVESDANIATKMQQTVNSYISKSKAADDTSVALAESEGISKGGVDNMTEETQETVVEDIEKSVEGSAEQIEEVVAEESVEKSAEEATEAVAETTDSEESVETEVATPDTAALIEDFKAYVSEALGGVTASASKAASAAVETAVSEVTKAFDSKIEVLESTIKSLASDLEATKEEFGGVAKRLGAVEGETAMKKSGELGREPEQSKKSMWAGSFLNADEL